MSEMEQILTKEDLAVFKEDLAVFKMDIEQMIDRAFNRIRAYLFIMTVIIMVVMKYL